MLILYHGMLKVPENPAVFDANCNFIKIAKDSLLKWLSYISDIFTGLISFKMIYQLLFYVEYLGFLVMTKYANPTWSFSQVI